MLRFFLVVSLCLLLLLICGCRSIDFKDPAWWSPLEVREPEHVARIPNLREERILEEMVELNREQVRLLKEIEDE